MKKNIVLLPILFLGLSNISAQDYNNPLQKIIPNPPEVSSIGKYLEKPISLSNGSVSINIPLFTYGLSENLSIPINLNYYGDGVKINENASSIGLGWSLSTLSFINRKINGTLDNYNSPFLDNLERAKNALFSLPGSVEYAWLENSIESLDTQPDEFIVNIFGNSFRLYFDGTQKKFLSVPKNDYLIESNIINGYVQSFIIIDTEGNKFYFGSSENSQTIDFGSTIYGTEYGNIPSNPPYTNSWYLSKIITKNNKEVKFSYVNNTISEQTIPYEYDNISHTSQYMYINTTDNFLGSRGKYDSWNVNNENNNFNIYPTSDAIVDNNKVNIIYNTYSESNVSDLILDKIYIDEKILAEFIKSSSVRKDHRSYKYDKINIYNSTNKIIKSFNFQHSYFNDEYPLPKEDCAKSKVYPSFKEYYEKSRYRLRLDNISYKDEKDQNIYNYKIEYYSGELPSKLSYSQDLAGYYNGNNNCSLIPKQSYKFTALNNSTSLRYVGDANRNPNINFNKIGALKKIIYPTKGSIEFDYENHDYSEVLSPFYDEEMTTGKKFGGLRIKSIINKDSDNSVILERKFKYSELLNGVEYSTGVLIGIPIVVEEDYFKEINKLNGHINFPLKTSSNSLISYRKVIEETVSNNQTLKTEYTFKSSLGEVGDSNAQYRLSTPPFYWRIGKPFETIHFRDLTPVKEETLRYSTKGFTFINNKYVRIEPRQQIANSPYTTYTDFKYEFYPFFTEYEYVDSRKEKDYLSGGTITTETNYNYDSPNHLQLSKQTTQNSKGETLTTEYQYPPDLVGQEDYMKELTDANRIVEPVVVKQSVEGVYISEVHNQYNLFNGIIQKAAVHLKKGNGININTTTDRKITYNSYDAKGNLTQYTLENRIPVAIIWGYGGQYPVAKIEGFTFANVTSKLANYLTKIQNGTLTVAEQSTIRTLIPDAMITTYMYKPLVGVTSITGPNGQTEYYKYDASNRLQSIVNDKQEVLKTFQYNYKQP
ncbi:RHS repeat domain-containing protein [Empedobacter tilapiae]|uniref:RHS repeat protein n=1 Tax=Empedobacter tilapiae TaxID=2491114 RepID=A0A4Z1BMP4_9FLAO|nr:hypothetical protein [Empedobacter tilapiae]TGN26169.1 hypothetical protein E4J94_12545 [Empedobacter tilapiae]